MRGILAACAATAAALVAAGSAWASEPSTYADPAGDASGGVDITNVTVGNQIDGPIVISLAVGSEGADAGDVTYGILFDTDRNARTGNAGGYEYMFVDAADGWDFLKWNGSDWDSTGDDVHVLPSGDASRPFALSIAQADLGSPPAFDFTVVTIKGDDAATAVFDYAPDDGVWSYKVATRPQIASVALTLSGAPKAGSTFGAKGATLGLVDGTKVKAQYLTCKITVGGKRVAGNACWVTLKKTDRGKTVVITATATYEQASMAKTVRVKVR